MIKRHLDRQVPSFRVLERIVFDACSFFFVLQDSWSGRVLRTQLVGSVVEERRSIDRFSIDGDGGGGGGGGGDDDDVDDQ